MIPSCAQYDSFNFIIYNASCQYSLTAFFRHNPQHFLDSAVIPCDNKKTMSDKFRFPNPFKKTVSTFARLAASIVLIACIIFTITISVTFFSRPIPLFGILISTIISCFLTVPATLLLEPLFKQPVKKQDSHNMEGKLAAQQNEIKTLKARNEELQDKSSFYERKIQLLENLSSNLDTYKDVFKVCFRDYQQNATIKQRERLAEANNTNHLKKWLSSSSKNYDEILSIMECLITYQRGIDLQNIRIAKIKEDTVVVSGIVPEYTTPPRFDYQEFFSELRHVKQDKNGKTKNVKIKTDDKSQLQLAKKQDEYKAMFEEAFKNGSKQDDDAPEIIKRAQDFIKIILQPIYKYVEFDDNAVISKNPMPILDFLRSEQEFCDKMLNEPEESTVLLIQDTGASSSSTDTPSPQPEQ